MTKRSHFIEVTITARIPFEKGDFNSIKNAITVSDLIEPHREQIGKIAGVASCTVTATERAEKVK